MNEMYITKSYEQTQKLGEEFAQSLFPGDVVMLFGNLGAGKTTFMQGLAKGLGIHHRIISPTFIIVRKYEVAGEDAKIKKLYHIDLYRTETRADLESIGLPEILQDTEAVVAIEWPEKMGKLLPKKRREIYFKWISEDKREITSKKFPI